MSHWYPTDRDLALNADLKLDAMLAEMDEMDKKIEQLAAAIAELKALTEAHNQLQNP